MSSRDADYRGRPSSIDWSRLVHETRLRKPGALEVLQDAILTWFPEQFREAQQGARSLAASYGKNRPDRPVAVGFMAHVARRRFEATPAAGRPIKQGPLTSPFILRYVEDLRTSKPEPKVAFVWSTRGGGKGGMRPRYTGSYKRPKLPVLYYDLDKSQTEGLALSFYVRGQGAGAWGKHQQSILGTHWESSDPDFAYAIVGWVPADWRRRLRQEGYKNRLIQDR